MPNVKIYVDRDCSQDAMSGLQANLEPLRALLCARLMVPSPACQFAILPVFAMPDQPAVNVEVAILQKAERTRDVLTELAKEIRQLLAAATGVHIAVRISSLDPATYVTLKD